MENTEIVQEQEQTVQTALQDYCRLKFGLKGLQKELRNIEKKAIETEEYKTKKEVITYAQEELKEMEQRNLEDNIDDVRWKELRMKILEVKEQKSHARAALSEKCAELPPEPTQLSLDLDSGPITVTIQDEKTLYFNGRKEN
ncbi:MAG: hypothetical protein KAS07_03085 [Candidatus Pacebacteria bacterium]|nr:hypothetical protein [Candidatus Paceibacterota bacterium]